MIIADKDLPKDWHWVRCQDVIDVRDGTHDTPKYITQGIPLITSKNLTRGFLDFSDVFFISEADHKQIKKRSKVDKDDIIMPMIGTIGNPVIVDTDKEFSIKNVALFKFENSSVFSPFFYYLLQSPLIVNQLAADAQGVTQQFVSLGSLRDLQIPLPPLAEQKRIAAIAQKADRLRRTRRYALQLSDTYLRSVFLEMFGDPVTNPKGWQTGQLNELCDKVIDCPHSTPIYALDETPYACIRSSDIQKGYLDWSTTKYVDYDEYVKRVARSIPLLGDVIYCREGARFGNAAKIPTGKKVCLGQRMMLFRADFKVATPEFIWGFLNCERTYQQAVRRVGGTASPHVNVEDIKAFATIIPPLPLQEKFAEIVQKFDRLRTQQREADRQAEHLFQTLLHRAFRGELTYQNADDEPESVLLEEIRAQQAKAEAEAKTATQAMGEAADYLGTKAKQQDIEPIQLKFPGFE